MIIVLHNLFSLDKLNVELHLLHSLPRPTKSRKHLTLNKNVFELSQERDQEYVTQAD